MRQLPKTRWDPFHSHCKGKPAGGVDHMCFKPFSVHIWACGRLNVKDKWDVNIVGLVTAVCLGLEGVLTLTGSAYVNLYTRLYICGILAQCLARLPCKKKVLHLSPLCLKLAYSLCVQVSFLRVLQLPVKDYLHSPYESLSIHKQGAGNPYLLQFYIFLCPAPGYKFVHTFYLPFQFPPTVQRHVGFRLAKTFVNLNVNVLVKGEIKRNS